MFLDVPGLWTLGLWFSFLIRPVPFLPNDDESVGRVLLFTARNSLLYADVIPPEMSTECPKPQHPPEKRFRIGPLEICFAVYGVRQPVTFLGNIYVTGKTFTALVVKCLMFS